jgi:hypothetical protein
MVGSCEHGNETSDSGEGGEIPDQLSDSQLHKKEFSSWSALVLPQVCYDKCTNVYVLQK